jgi:Tfp pilus assembly protein PilX
MKMAGSAPPRRSLLAGDARRHRPQSERGTVLLVALCFVTVLGISLAAYIAVCSRTMQISNRTFQTGLSQQLAEAGLEEALRAFNKSSWSDWSNGVAADWTVSGTTATCNLTFPAGQFGQGVTGSVKIRVDNYNANQLGSTWSSFKTYRIGDQVGYNGIWYSCVQSHGPSQTPSGLANLAYWVPSHIPWTWRPNSNYTLYDVVNYNGTWYRCTSSHVSPASWSATNWTTIGAIRLYNAGNYHNVGDIVYNPDTTTWYRVTGAGTPGSFSATAMISWQYRSGTTYSFNDLVCYGSSYTWYRYINATAASGNLPTNTTYWENALTGGVHGWSSSSINYSLGDVVYHSGTSQWYRCILAHTSSGSITPSNASYWSNTPLLSMQWKSGPYYAANDLVSYNGVWYLCILAHTSSTSILPTNTSYWIGANTTNTSYVWNSGLAYSVGNYRCYGGVWYRCSAATTANNTTHNPNNTSYWSASWAQSAGVTTGAPVIYAEGTINIAGSGATKTQLRATIAPASLFPNAAAATTNLTISSGTGTVDSYNSTVETYSAGIAGSSAVLAAGSTLAINGTTAIKGYLAWPSPPAGISTGTTINGLTLSSDKSRVSRSPFIPQFDALPSPSLSSAFGSWNFPYGRLLATNPGGTVTIGTPGATTPSRYYYSSSLDIASSTSYEIGTLNINGPVILYIDGNLRIRTGGTIEIAATGSAEIHADGGIRIDETSNGFNNRTLDPKKLILISDVSGTTTQYYDDTTNAFYGAIYVPNTTATLGFEVDTGVNLYGALSAKNITFSSEATLHYDTSLRYAQIRGVDQPYAVTDWRVLDATNLATMP